jgi:arabinogalactan endo-1,4-beta-galactosidase
VVNDLAYTLKLARRVKEAGADLLLDFHYSDTWADPGRQEVPAAWRGLTADALAAQVEQYTFETIKAFVAADVAPTMVQIGNEIDNGMLTTHNAIWTDHPAGWKEFARLFQAGVRGVRRAQPADQPIQIIFHSASGGLVERSRALVEKLVEHGFEYDIHGLSYYPWWHGKLKGLQENIRLIVTEFDKDVLLVEVAYPWKKPHPKSRLWNGVDEWETTPAGQAVYLRDVSRTVFTAPDGRGLGVLWWFPESTPIGEQPTWNGGETALFTPAGNPLPAVSVFQEFRRSGPLNPTQAKGDTP